jgi:probable sporulation protein (polysaccharide deacetylase family)
VIRVLRGILLALALLQAGAAGVRLSHFAEMGAVPAVAPENRAQQLVESARRLERPPVDARIDRVWHAIPGLSGWELNVDKSVEETRRIKDGQVHLIWNRVRPRVSLADLRPEPIYRGPKEERAVSLMFNVSWGEEHVPSILRTLTTSGVKATFFLDGQWVNKHPDLARQIRDAGEEIGSHGTGHPDFRKLSAAKLERQVVGTNTVIQRTLGAEPTLLAPPAGSFDVRTVQAAARHRMYTILWTTDTVDWRRPSPAVILSRVESQVEPGSLVLMHPTAPTAAALPELIRWLKANGYRFKTVGQVVREEPVAVPPASLSEKT